MSEAHPAASDPTALFTRRGWPDELAILLAAHPRPTWRGHQNLGALSRFWLQRHQMFRELGRALSAAATDLAENRTDPAGFAQAFLPRAKVFLGELHAHHTIEDVHYFPVFRAADTRLARGFDVLEGDHETLDALIHRFAQDANALSRLRPGEGAREAQTLAATAAQMLEGTLRHLDDEEDLIIPLILEQTEERLGVG